jgi:hypothetical protein
MLTLPISRAITSRIASAITAGIASAPVAESPAVPEIGSVVTQDGQLYMSTLPANPFNPNQYGWELYGEET